MAGNGDDIYVKFRQYLDKYRTHQAAGDDGLLSLVKLDVQNRPQVNKSLVVVQECLVTIEASAQAQLSNAGIVMPMVADLARAAIGVPEITFKHIRSDVGLNKVLEALASPSRILIDIAFDCVGKATRPSDASLVGGQAGLVEQIIRIWLQTPDTSLSERAIGVLLALLKLDAAPDELGYSGSGYVWKRVFAEPHLYEELFLSTSNLRNERLSDKKSFTFRFSAPASRSVRQGRLFTFVLEVAKLHYDAIALSNHLDIETSFQREKRSSQESSLLNYVAKDMCDEDDDLVDLVRFQFFTSLLEIQNPARALATVRSAGYASPTLDYLEKSQIHSFIIDRYLSQTSSSSSVEGSLFQDSYVQYLSTYFRIYPHHAYITNRIYAMKILDTIAERLDIPKGRWAPADGRAPKDVHILQDMPPSMLFQGPGYRAYQSLPTNPANPSALRALAKLFHGRQFSSSGGSLTKTDERESGFSPAGSRLLFFLYLHAHPAFWADLAAAINVTMNPDATKQAIDLARSIATANWQELPEDPITGNWPIPSESQMQDKLNFNTGLAAVLMTGSQVWRALLTPVVMPKMNATGDASSIHWSISALKLDALEEVLRTMSAGTGRKEIDSAVWESAYGLLVSTIREWRFGRSIVNPEIQTMEL